MITNTQSRTRIDEIADGIYRISTPLPELLPGGSSFNQYLIVDDEPLLFHTGLRRLFPLVREAIESVMPVSRLRSIAFSHTEADECGALNDFLGAAPDAQPLCSRIAAMVSINDLADRPARGAADGERINTGRHELEWIDAPHLPHGWDAGYLFDHTTRTLFCGDLFTQGGMGGDPVTGSDILEPSEAFRQGGIAAGMSDYFSHAPSERAAFQRMADTRPTTLACMHGSAWTGTGGSALLMALADRVGR
jgi:flavorubredoxin